MSIARVVRNKEKEEIEKLGRVVAAKAVKLAKVILNKEDMPKEAQGGGRIGPVLAGTALGAILPIGTYLTMRGMENAADKRNKAKTWASIVARYPEMNTPDMMETYDALFDLSPSIMKHPRLAIPALRRSGEYGTGGIPADLAQTLVQTDAARTRGSQRLNEDILSGAHLGIEAAKATREQ